MCDCAGTDFAQRFRWHENGFYFLSREKENVKLTIVGNLLFDRDDRINQGVLSVEIVGTSVGLTVRRVFYQDPENGITYNYLTNLPSNIPFGVVSLLPK